MADEFGRWFALWALWRAWRRRPRPFAALWARGGALPARGPYTGLLMSDADRPGLSWRYLPGRVECRDVPAYGYREHLMDETLVEQIIAMCPWPWTEARPADPPIKRVVWL